MSTTPYLAPRLRILAEYTQDDGFAEWRRYIAHWADPHSPIEKPEIKPRARPKDDRERMTCAACGAKMSVPKEALASGKPVNVRCPNTDCRKVLRVKPKTKPATPSSVDKNLDAKKAAAAKVRLSCVSCNEAMYVDKQALQGGEAVNVRCPNPACGEVLSIKPKSNSNPQRPDLMAD